LKVHKHQNFFGLIRNLIVHMRNFFDSFLSIFVSISIFQNLVLQALGTVRKKTNFMLVYTSKTKISVTCRVVCKTSSSSRPCWCRPSCPRPDDLTTTATCPSMTAGRTTANLSATKYPDGPWWSLVYGVW
jgi:hypothetical protein